MLVVPLAQNVLQYPLSPSAGCLDRWPRQMAEDLGSRQQAPSCQSNLPGMQVRSVKGASSLAVRHFCTVPALCLHCFYAGSTPFLHRLYTVPAPAPGRFLHRLMTSLRPTSPHLSIQGSRRWGFFLLGYMGIMLQSYSSGPRYPGGGASSPMLRLCNASIPD